MISVIAVSKNRAKEVERLHRSLTAQAVNCPWEMIVVDVDSSDYPDLLPNEVKVVSIKTDFPTLNLSHARNVGAIHAKYDWLMFLDADLVPDRGFLDIMAEHINRYDTSHCFGTIRKTLRSDGGVMARNPDFWGFCQTIPRNLFNKVNGYNETFIGWGGEDAEMGKRLVEAGATIKIVSKTGVTHPWHELGQETWKIVNHPTVNPDGEYFMDQTPGQHTDLSSEKLRDRLRAIRSEKEALEETVAMKQREIEAANARVNRVTTENESLQKRLRSVVTREAHEQEVTSAYNRGDEAGRACAFAEADVKIADIRKEELDRRQVLEAVIADQKAEIERLLAAQSAPVHEVLPTVPAPEEQPAPSKPWWKFW